MILTPIIALGNDLLSVYSQAKTSDPIYRQKKLELKEEKYSVSRARANVFLPKVAISASKTKVGQDISLQSGFGSGGNTNFVSTQYRVTLNQSIFDASKLINLNQAKKKAKKKEISYSNSGQELIFRVIEGYLKVLSAENSLTFTESEAQSLKSQLQRIIQRFEVGLVALTDVQEAKAGFDRANAERLKAENELDLAMDNLRKITGTRYAKLKKIDIDIPLIEPSPSKIEKWVENAMKGNLKIAESRIDELIQRDQLRKSRARYTPKLEIVGSHGTSEQGGRFGSSEVDNTDIGLQLNIPIFHGGDVYFQAKKEATHVSEKLMAQVHLERVEHSKSKIIIVLSPVIKTRRLPTHHIYIICTWYSSWLRTTTSKSPIFTLIITYIYAI